GGSAFLENWGVVRWNGISMADIAAPADTVAITEAHSPVVGFPDDLSSPRSPNYWWRRYAAGAGMGNSSGRAFKVDCFVTNRHSGGANYVFADGHTKFFTRGTIAGNPPGQANCNNNQPVLNGANARVNNVNYWYFWRGCPPDVPGCGK